MRPIAISALLIASGVAYPALADPCEAPLPARAGETFSGPVTYVGDGDSLCVSTSEGQVEVRLADFDAPELNSPQGRMSREHLKKAALRKQAVCTVARGRSGRTTSYDRVIAVCRVGGRSLGQWLRSQGAPRGGN